MSNLLHAVFSRPTSKIDLTFDNKVIVTFPSSRLEFLKGVDQTAVESIKLSDKNTVLVWPEIDQRIEVTELLRRLFGG